MVLMQPEILERIQFDITEDRTTDRRGKANGK
jgi:hypothetical protein